MKCLKIDHTSENGELNCPIMSEEICVAFISLKLGKAAGIDGITNEMIKGSTCFMINAYASIFNHIFNLSVYPNGWKKGLVNLSKNGDPFNEDNYRGLTINSCLGKVFNTVLNNRLST